MRANDRPQHHAGPATHDRGFTLIEILVAIVLVGVLSAVVVIGVGALSGSGSSASCTASKDAATTALDVHLANSGSYPTTFTAMIGTNPPELSLSGGVSADASGLSVSGSGWTLVLTPGVSGAKPILTCDTGVPDGFSLGPNGHYYRYVSTQLTWQAAATAAAELAADGHAGHLATITSPAEQAFVVSLVGNAWAWLGAHDQVTEGDWRWTVGPEAGTPFWSGGRPAEGGAPIGGAYTTWEPSIQPDNQGNEDCMHIRGNSSGNWNDWFCTSTIGYVVELG